MNEHAWQGCLLHSGFVQTGVHLIVKQPFHKYGK